MPNAERWMLNGQDDEDNRNWRGWFACAVCSVQRADTDAAEGWRMGDGGWRMGEIIGFEREDERVRNEE